MIDWLVFDPAQRAEALKQGNAIMRKFLGMLYFNIIFSSFCSNLYILKFCFVVFFCFSNVPMGEGRADDKTTILTYQEPSITKQNI